MVCHFNFIKNCPQMKRQITIFWYITKQSSIKKEVSILLNLENHHNLKLQQIDTYKIKIVRSGHSIKQIDKRIKASSYLVKGSR